MEGDDEVEVVVVFFEILVILAEVFYCFLAFRGL